MVRRVLVAWVVFGVLALLACRGGDERGVGGGAPLGQGKGDFEFVGVRVEVDFGPLQKEPLEVAVRLPLGADVVAATRAAVPVVQRWLCCDERDVWAVAGVGPDPRLDRYWMWLLDGKMGPNTAAEHLVEDGDRITWRLSKGALGQEVGNLGRDLGLVVLDEGALLALWHIGAEGHVRAERLPGESAEELLARAANSEVEWALASERPDADFVDALAAAGIRLDVLDLHNGDLGVRLVAWEQLGEHVDRLGAARIAARLDRPLARDSDPGH